MNRPSRLKLSDVNPNLICVLCGGYFIDATTIVECLHSFCKTCIVRYLETSKYCPICDVQVHKTKPLLNIRADHTLQNIVYKLVPGLYQNEMKQRQEFYAHHPEVPPVSEYDAGVINEETSCIYCPDETIALCLEYSMKASTKSPTDTAKSEQLFSPLSKDCHQHRRYFRCPAAVTVSHLKKLLRSKYGISADHRVDVMYNDELLKEEYSLLDVAYIYLWKRKGVMRFTYRIFERPHKRRRLDLERYKTASNFIADAAAAVKSEPLGDSSEIKAVEDSKCDSERLIHDQTPSLSELELKAKASDLTKVKCDMSMEGGEAEGGSGEEWKEVQLQISENGIMSVRNMDDLVTAVEGGVLSCAFNETIISSGKAEEGCGEPGKSGVDSTPPTEKDRSKSPQKMKELAENSKETIGDDQSSPKNKSSHPEDVVVKPQSLVDNKDVSGPVAPTLSTKSTAMDRMSGQKACGGVKYSFPKKEVSVKPKDMNSKEVSGEVDNSVPALECIPSSNSSQPCAIVAVSTVTPSVTLTPIPPTVAASSLPTAPTIPKRSSSAPVGYKTLKTPPKTWNPSIPRARVLANNSTFGKSAMGSTGSLNGNIGVSGQSTSPLKVEGRVDGKINSTSIEGGGNVVRLPPTSSPKPLRFFKMRNNMPRYLGNPSSGVKPMYSVHPGAAGGGGITSVVPKPSLPLTKTDAKTNSVVHVLPTSSLIMTECKTDKITTVTSMATFPLTPTSRSGHKPLSGAVSQTMASTGHSPPATFLQTSPTVSHASSAQLTVPRNATTTTQSMPPPTNIMSSSGYHPSLPPSISMIFGQSRPMPGERPTSQTPPPPPPAVQRVPASVHHPHHFHHPVTPIHLLQHRQAVTKTPGKLNGDLGSSNDNKPFSKIEKPPDSPPPLVLASPSSEILKGKEGPSREVAVKEPVNGKLETSSLPALTPPPPVVDGKSMAPSKC